MFEQRQRRSWRRFIGWLTPVLLAAATLAALRGADRETDDHPRLRERRVQPDDQVRFRVDVVARGIRVPWSMAFLPDGRAIVTQRQPGRMHLVDLATGQATRIGGVPPVFASGQGGLLDVVLHPDYDANRWIYFSYSANTPRGATTVVDRARLRANQLVDRERIFTAQALSRAANHFGGRLVLHDGYLFLSVGDRTDRYRAQQLDSHHGKVLRVHDDGRVPDDNPFVGRNDALPEIWTYGHRNPQGLTRHPTTGALWEHEHGPRGGDEVNLIRPGLNYGWPVISYGQEYRGGPVGAGITRKEGMEQPLHYYVPSIAPSGMVFYTGSAFPEWQGNLFIGAMVLQHLNRLVLDGDRVVREERLLVDQNWRVRFVTQGPDGLLYLGVDEGMIVRLSPE